MITLTADDVARLQTRIARLEESNGELVEALERYVAEDFEMQGNTAKAENHNARLAAAHAALARAKERA